MLARIGADAVLVVHFAFVLFVLLGGLAVLRWPKLAWVHVPAMVWGALVELEGWICPLTPLEVVLREAAGEAGYRGDFLQQYMFALLYPEGLTREMQMVFAGLVVLINGAFYLALARRARGHGRGSRRVG